MAKKYYSKFIPVGTPTPAGWTKVGNIAVDINEVGGGDSGTIPGISSDYDTTSYIIITDTTTAGLVGRSTGAGSGTAAADTPTYWISMTKDETGFVNLVNRIPARSGQAPFTNGADALSWLNVNGYWSTYVNPVATTFSSTWNTNLGQPPTPEITLPLIPTGNYNFTVNWGDGTSDTINTWNQAESTHTYATGGVYTISITGLIEGWNFGASFFSSTKITTINSWGPLILGDSYAGSFQECLNLSNLSSITDIPDFTGMTSLNGLFYSCPLTTIGKIGDWNVSNITNMAFLFCYTEFFGDISSWDVSNVTSMSFMFSGSNFNSNIGGWTVSSVTDMSFMFENTPFDQDISNWDVSNVTTMEGMFDGGSLSYQNYDNLLNAWSQLTLKPNVLFGVGSTPYTAAGQAARNILTSPPNNWIITDGGLITP